MNTRAHLSVVIVNYRTPNLVIDCLVTLLPELQGLDARVVIVDNHSLDDSATVIRKWLAVNDNNNLVLLLESPVNAGFASGNNLGIKAISAQLYLLLNSDTLIRPGAIHTLINTALNEPKAGLLSPRLEWPDGLGQESCFRFHTPMSELIGSAQTGAVDKLLKKHVVPMPLQTQISTPDWTSFACVLIKDEVIQDIGLLDEGYFMYFEDVAFCHRAQNAGWTIVHNPEAHVVHLRGGSSPVKAQTIMKKRVPKYFYESRARFFYEVYGWTGLVAANVLWWAGRLISKSRQILGRSDKAAVDRQWLDIWSNWLNPLKKFTIPKN